MNPTKTPALSCPAGGAACLDSSVRAVGRAGGMGDQTMPLTIDRVRHHPQGYAVAVHDELGTLWANVYGGTPDETLRRADLLTGGLRHQPPPAQADREKPAPVGGGAAGMLRMLGLGLLLSLALSPLAAEEPAKKPRVRPEQTISVKVYPAAHYRAKAGDAPHYLSTVTETTCTAWVPAPGGEAPEQAAYKACRRAIAEGAK